MALLPWHQHGPSWPGPVAGAQPKAWCLLSVPGWSLSQGWSQGFPEAATPCRPRSGWAALLKAGSVSPQPAWLGWFPQVSSNSSLDPLRAAPALWSRDSSSSLLTPPCTGCMVRHHTGFATCPQPCPLLFQATLTFCGPSPHLPGKGRAWL